MFSLEATAVALHPTKKKVAYAAADGILYRTTNNGDFWRPVIRVRGAGRALLQRFGGNDDVRRLKDRILEEKLEDLAAEVGEQRAQELRDSLEREAEEEAERQIAAQRRRSASVRGSGRFRRRIHRIILPPSQPNWVGIATDAGFFLSRDGGKTFKHEYRGRAPGEGDVRVVRVDPANPKRIWLGTRVGLWHTDNGGQQWRRDTGNLRTSPIREIRFDRKNPKRMYVASDRSVFLSRNSGATFRRLWTQVSGTRRIVGLALLEKRSRTELIVATGNGLFRSRNSQNFQRLSAAGIGSRQIKYVTSLSKFPKWLYVVNDQGVFVSKNGGGRFRQLREGMLTPDIRWIAVRRDDPNEIWAATDYGVLRWSKYAAGRATAGQWRRFRKRLGLEPSAWDLAQAVLRFMQLPQRLGKLQSRNAARAWLPQVAARAILALDEDRIFQTLFLGQRRPVRVLEGRAFYFEVVLQWRLGRTVFDNQQLRVVSESRNLRRKQQRLLNRVIRLYHARKRLMLRLFAAPPRSLRAYMKKVLKLQEISAYLNALSGDYLRRELKRRGLLRKQWGLK